MQNLFLSDRHIMTMHLKDEAEKKRQLQHHQDESSSALFFVFLFKYQLINATRFNIHKT